MPPIPGIRIEWISFWLGVLAAFILKALYNVLKNLFSRINQNRRQRAAPSKRSPQTGIDILLRQETLRLAQRQHLAGGLFPLDDVLIPPLLVAPPPTADPQSDLAPVSITQRVIPYLPDWPEFSAQYCVPTLSLAEALQEKARIAVIGQPGSGKSVTLAHLATQVARRQPAAGCLAGCVPAWLHVLDLDLDLSEKHDPLENICRSISGRISGLVRPRLASFLEQVSANGDLLLLLDGLDELPPPGISRAAAFLAALLQKHPHIRLACSASPDYWGELADLKLVPLAVKAWSYAEKLDFAEKWGQLWLKNQLPGVGNTNNNKEIDRRLLNHWLSAENTIATPLEWVSLVWSAYANDLQGPSGTHGLDATIRRLHRGAAPRAALETLAAEMVSRGQAALSFREIEKSFSRYKSKDSADLDQFLQVETSQEAGLSELAARRRKKKKETRRSTWADAIFALLDNGLLVEHAGEQICFANPLICGYLAGFQETPQPPSEFAPFQWSVRMSAARYQAAQDKLTPWIETALADPEDAPLYRKILAVGRWIGVTPPRLAWRTSAMRAMMLALYQEQLPLSTRARIAGAFISSNDPSVATLFKQMLTSPHPSLRQLAALSLGAMRDLRSQTELKNLLADSDRQVRVAASLALGALDSQQSLQIVGEILLSGDEDMQQAAAEIFAAHPQPGYDTLKDAVNMDDLMVRRAAVIGLSLIPEAWAGQILEKVSLEDGQWVVRNAASHTIENVRRSNTHIPRPLPAADQNPWLIQFASQHGQGIVAGSDAADVLLLALRRGNPEEQLASLEYLARLPGQGIVDELCRIIYSGPEELREACLHTLWQLSLRA